jgi:transcriptional regulator with XRE-family HTH domain
MLNKFILAERLKDLRERNNLKRKQLADKVNVSYYSIRSYELAERVPDLNILMKLADVFEVSVDFLLGRDDYLPEKYAKFKSINLLDIQMVYESNKKIMHMIDNCRKDK